LGNLPQTDVPDPYINPTSDSCVECSTTIEEACIEFRANSLPAGRWHQHCLKCSLCRRFSNADQALWSESKQRVVCDSCARNRNVQRDFVDLQPGFEQVTLLSQFIFLLRVALTRLESILRDSEALPHTSGTPP
jgi:hypothetical protein